MLGSTIPAVVDVGVGADAGSVAATGVDVAAGRCCIAVSTSTRRSLKQ
jgi:hypothetical protein